MDRANVFRTMGATSFVGNREENDFYATEPKATELLLEKEVFNKDILEPCAGMGHIRDVLVSNGYNVTATDLIYRGVDDIKQIPDTNEIIGVPITFLDKYNPEQFEILGMSGDREFVDSDCDFFIPVTKEQKNIFKEQNKDWRDTHPYFSDGDKLTKLLYVRLFIRKKGT